MLIKYSYWCGIISLAALFVFSGCKKQVTKIKPTTEPVAETKPSIPEPKPVDTSDEVSFKEAELEAEFERKVKENLKAIYFDYDSYKLRQEAINRLAVAGNFLMDNPNLRVLIEGHCDERGSSEYNMGLGENRARVIKDYLAKYGIQVIKMEITSWGKEHPALYGCTNAECHSQNRRAAFKVLAH